MIGHRRLAWAGAVALAAAIASVVMLSLRPTVPDGGGGSEGGPEVSGRTRSDPKLTSSASGRAPGIQEPNADHAAERTPLSAARDEPASQFASLDLTLLDPQGEPVAGADVRLCREATGAARVAHRNSTPALRTDREGRLSAGDLDPRLNRIEVIAAGRGWAQESLHLSGGVRCALSITLSPFCNVWGRVLADGEAVTGARVHLFGALGSVLNADSDDAGLFELFDIPGGPAYLGTSHPEYGAVELELSLPAGEVRRQDLYLGACSRLEGRVLGTDGTPCSMWQVRVVPRDRSEPPRDALSDEKGRWHIAGLPKGVYDLEARRPYWTDELPGARFVGVDPCVAGELILRAEGPPSAGALQGHVMVQGLEPERSVEVCARRSGSEELLCVEQRTGVPDFVIEPLSSDEYDILVRVDGLVVLQMARAARVEVDRIVDIGRIVVPAMASMRVLTVAGSSVRQRVELTLFAEPLEEGPGSPDLPGRFASGALGEALFLDLLAQGLYRLVCSGNGLAEVQRVVEVRGPGEHEETLVLEDGCFVPVSVHAPGIQAAGAQVELQVISDTGLEPWLVRRFAVGGSRQTWSGASLAEGSWRIRIVHVGAVLSEARVEIGRDRLGRLGATPVEPFVLEFGR